MSEGLVTVSYIGATILFILTLGGLSNQETARRGNMYGMLGMTIAVIATVLGPEVTKNTWLIIMMMIIGGGVGLTLAKKVQMTQMPELVAILHSLVGFAAVLVGYVNFMDHSIIFATI
jgi:NAD(P) transhydrogenase subunit beta